MDVGLFRRSADTKYFPVSRRCARAGEGQERGLELPLRFRVRGAAHGLGQAQGGALPSQSCDLISTKSVLPRGGLGHDLADRHDDKRICLAQEASLLLGTHSDTLPTNGWLESLGFDFGSNGRVSLTRRYPQVSFVLI